jgi:NAD+ synthase
MMKENKEILRIDPASEAKKLVSAIRETFEKKGFSRAVVGISGGLDSAVVSYLLVKALGKENVTACIMPYGAQDTKDAEEVVCSLGIKAEKIDISPMVDAYFSKRPDADKVRQGNKMARERMSILYDQSQRIGALVAGTGNRTELDLGYFTLHGDGACAVAPLASLYKTQVIQLAEYLGVPEEVVKKKPSAGFWEGQTDEDEIGVLYADIDCILYYLDNNFSAEEIAEKGYDKSAVEIVINRIRQNRFKLEGPVFL